MSKRPENIILVTFDQHRIDYPTMSYSVASILATLKHYNIPASHYSFDIRKFSKSPAGYMPIDVVNDIDDIVNYLKRFSCIAIGMTCWSVTFAGILIRKLEDYKGKIVVGGYEITAMKEDGWVADFFKEQLNISHLIKGYAEKPLVKLMKGEYPDSEWFIREDLDEEYLFSPYSGGVLNTYGRRIYWETKRGCKFHCGFCEWGNAQKDSVDLSIATINQDIEIFSKSNVEEINILDATFNVQNDYLDILQKLIEKTNAKITFQARFEALKADFMQFCALHKERVHLEFGLQTIHEKEMKVIGRRNKMSLIKEKINELNLLNIEYEVSVIYAIPGQTVNSFIDTIEFLRVNNCPKTMAFPLQIPSNSELDRKKKEYEIELKEDENYVSSVASSYSFTKEEREVMDLIASSLSDSIKLHHLPSKYLYKIENTEFQYQLSGEYVRDNKELFEPIFRDFPYSTQGEGLSTKYPETNDFLSIMEIVSSPFFEEFSQYSSMENTLKTPLESSAGVKYLYKVVCGVSGHVYIFREFIKVDNIQRVILKDVTI